MEDKTDYLNFIDKVYCPITIDFYDYFRIFTLLLQEEADKGRWAGIKAENFTAYEDSTLFSTDIGVKMHFVNYNFEITIGVRFIIEDSIGRYQIFLNADCPQDLRNMCYSCWKCTEKTRCRDSVEILILNLISSFIEVFETSDWSVDIIYDESGDEVGCLAESYGNNLLFHDFCNYLDRMNPIKSRLSDFEYKTYFENLRQYNLLFMKSRPLSGTLSKPNYYMAPYFVVYKKDSATIEEIYNNPHGMESEYHGEEPPF